jgi:hypothetical protein
MSVVWTSAIAWLGGVRSVLGSSPRARIEVGGVIMITPDHVTEIALDALHGVETLGHQPLTSADARALSGLLDVLELALELVEDMQFQLRRDGVCRYYLDQFDIAA